jgi:hypothetical protein
LHKANIFYAYRSIKGFFTLFLCLFYFAFHADKRGLENNRLQPKLT